jgi:hypothetical protein
MAEKYLVVRQSSIVRRDQTSFIEREVVSEVK